MKTIKKLFVLLLSLTIAFSCFSFANATDLETSNKSAFEQLCDDLYGNPDSYTIYNRENVDITLSYYNHTSLWYHNGDINSILTYYIENVGSIVKYESVARGSYQTVSTSHVFYREVNPPSMNNYDIVCTLTGRLTYNINTGKISSASSTLSLDHVDIGGLISAALHNVSTSATISTDKYSVLFGCQFYIKTTRSIPIVGEIAGNQEEITGPYSYSFRGYGE